MFGPLIRQATSLKERIPLLNNLGVNFIFIHYAYIITWAIVGSIVVFVGGGISYTDSLFLSVGAATQSGLNTRNLNELWTYQQIFLYWISMFTTPIFIHGGLILVRLYWFERRFQNVVREARAMRRTRSRMSVASEDKADDSSQAERGVGGRSIVVLRNNFGDARGSRLPDPVAHAMNESTTDADSPSSKSSNEQTSSDNTETTENNIPESRFGLGSLRVPTQLNPESHIAFVENQRKSKGALRIPSPGEFARGIVPEALEEEADEDNNESKPEPSSPDQNRQASVAHSEHDELGPLEGPHITINEPDFPRTRTRSNTIPRINTQPTMRDTFTKDVNEDGTENDGPLARTGTKQTVRGIWKSITQERERPTQPYLSWNATVARNSNFVDLTEEQRDELGGIEYRSLKTLAVVIVSYYVGIHLISALAMIGWIMKENEWGDVVRADGVGRPWWAIFTSGSAFNDVGFTLTPDSMQSFATAVFPMLFFAITIIIGNTGFPCALRFVIWILSKISRPATALREELLFLLDHPRRCFTLLFPRNATWWLTAILVALNGIDVIFFIILDLNDPAVTKYSPGIRVLDGFFQASATRTAGFGVVSLSDLHPAIQVSYLIMMYISVFPIAISMRRTNVYEEKSLGIWDIDDVQDEENQTAPSYISTHLRRQLSFDLWYVFLGLFVIAIAEGKRLQDANDYSFQLFTVLFEVVSAYGTVGLSFGYPGVDTSFSGQFNVISKLVIMAMQIRGRHRGLPVALDRAVLLPSDALNRQEAETAERRMRRRASNLSGGASMGPAQSRTLSQTQADAGLASGFEFRDFQPQSSNLHPVVNRSGTGRSQLSGTVQPNVSDH